MIFKRHIEKRFAEVERMVTDRFDSAASHIVELKPEIIKLSAEVEELKSRMSDNIYSQAEVREFAEDVKNMQKRVHLLETPDDFWDQTDDEDENPVCKHPLCVKGISSWIMNIATPGGSMCAPVTFCPYCGKKL